MSRLMLVLWIYLGTGFVVIVAIWCVSRINIEREEGQALANAFRPHRFYVEPRRWFDPFLQALGIVGGTILWPAMLFIVGSEVKASWRLRRWQQRIAPPFKVAKEHLQKRLSLEEIEAAEIIEDPLGGVPEVPFGHLAAAWRVFKAKHPGTKEMWTFQVERSQEGGNYRVAGYAVVIGNRVVDEFRTEGH